MVVEDLHLVRLVPHLIVEVCNAGGSTHVVEELVDALTTVLRFVCTVARTWIVDVAISLIVPNALDLQRPEGRGVGRAHTHEHDAIVIYGSEDECQ
ncbi:hypothetical protein D3C71_1964120 [compost metagenome]